ncbi:MAG: hypothetical protein R3E83_10765 [Burkholderiaceae bacterium]
MAQDRLHVQLPIPWSETHPLTHQSLIAEGALWEDCPALERMTYAIGG